MARSLEQRVRRRDIGPSQRNGADPQNTSINQPALCLYLAIEGLGQAELADSAEASVGRRGRPRTISTRPAVPAEASPVTSVENGTIPTKCLPCMHAFAGFHGSHPDLPADYIQAFPLLSGS